MSLNQTISLQNLRCKDLILQDPKSVETDSGHLLRQNGTLPIVSSETVLFLIIARLHFCQKLGKTLHHQSSGDISIGIVFECVLYFSMNDQGGR